jgi:hypothetical protein
VTVSSTSTAATPVDSKTISNGAEGMVAWTAWAPTTTINSEAQASARRPVGHELKIRLLVGWVRSTCT